MRTTEVVAPHFKFRLSGVTSTILQLVPLQARSLGIATLGPGLPADMPHMTWWQIPGLWRRPDSGKRRIWHARRNVEMAAGLLLRWTGAPVRLLFTSAAQRQHRPFTKWLIRRMDGVIATSGLSGARLDVPHTVVMHGIDLTKFSPGEKSAATLAEAGVPGRYAVGCFGRVRHQKGTDLFVDAMIDLLPRFPDWTAVICGRVTPEHAGFAHQLKARIEAAGLAQRILFLGEIRDIGDWYRRLDLYVAPSRNEGFGLTPLEAMACGVPVIASDAGAYREMLIEGRTGSIFPPGDLDGLRRALEPFLADPAFAKTCGAAALSDVTQRFPLEREAAQIAKVYDAIWARG